MSAGFLYDIHTHTSESSACGRISAVEIVRFYHQMGFSGICITDHFFNGSTTVPAHLAWAERVKRFCAGYEQARAEGERVGLDVFFGWEYTVYGADFLTYGLDREWLLENEDVLSCGMAGYCDRVHASGGFIVHAHPFREADYIERIQLLPRKVDAVETYNACRTDFENMMARQYAGAYGIAQCAGSDNHRGAIPKLGAMRTRTRMASVAALMRAIIDKTAEPVEIPVSAVDRRS